MTFSEYAQGLKPFISNGKMKKYAFFVALIGNFIQDGAMDACELLCQAEDTRTRYISGSRSISAENAQYVYDHRDLYKFSAWLSERIDDSDSLDNVAKWLSSNGQDDYDPAESCADLLEKILLAIINNTTSKSKNNLDVDLKLIDDIQKKIESLPQPTNVPVPKVVAPEEQIYISELYRAYGDAENMDSFTSNDLPAFPDYSDDLDDRRIDFYAAEAIRRSVLELGNGSLAKQFDVLKKETLDGVKDTERRTYNNGYERMLSVMEQAVKIPINDYILCSSPYWINGKIKKGVCHHLVNDGKLLWVRRRKK